MRTAWPRAGDTHLLLGCVLGRSRTQGFLQAGVRGCRMCGWTPSAPPAALGCSAGLSETGQASLALSDSSFQPLCSGNRAGHWPAESPGEKTSLTSKSRGCAAPTVKRRLQGGGVVGRQARHHLVPLGNTGGKRQGKSQRGLGGACAVTQANVTVTPNHFLLKFLSPMCVVKSYNT